MIFLMSNEPESMGKVQFIMIMIVITGNNHFEHNSWFGKSSECCMKRLDKAVYIIFYP